MSACSGSRHQCPFSNTLVVRELREGMTAAAVSKPVSGNLRQSSVKPPPWVESPYRLRVGQPFCRVVAPVMIATASVGVCDCGVMMPAAAAESGDVDAVGDLEHVGHVVADQDDGQALCLDLADQVEDLTCFLNPERGRGFVQDDELGWRRRRRGRRLGVAHGPTGLSVRPGPRRRAGTDPTARTARTADIVERRLDITAPNQRKRIR